MQGDARRLHTASPTELKERIEEERKGSPFLVYRDGAGRQRIFALGGGIEHVTIGRRDGNDVALEHDPEVSRLHAELRRISVDWTLADDGLSRNGCFVNDTRVIGRSRLRDGDVMRFGRSTVLFRSPSGRPSEPTLVPKDEPHPVRLSDTKRRVLVALCRPLAESPFATPATNKQIAGEVFLSVQGVKAHLRELFSAFGLESASQYQKRANLAWAALASGTVSPAELTDSPPDT